MSATPGLLTRFLKYGGVAAGSALSDWLIFLSLTCFGLSPVMAQVFSRVAGGLFSFICNRYWSFDAGKVAGVTLQGRRFLLLYGFSYCLSIALLSTFLALGLPTYISKLLGDTTCLVINFSVMQLYVFNARPGISSFLKPLFRGSSRRG